jgi:thiol-disulfide isomerase/thioredoxin
MNNKKRTIASIIVFIIFLAIVYLAYNSLSDSFNQSNDVQPPLGEISSQEGSENKAADFTVIDNKGNEIRLSDNFGKPIVLNFWASWCPPCREEMPYFDEVYADVKKDVVFMMVDLVDGRRETQEKGQNFINDNGFDLPIYFDIEQIAAAIYGISSIPTTIFINKDGEVVLAYQGPMDKESLIIGIDIIK